MSLTELNLNLFEWINASSHASDWMIHFAIFIANDLFYIMVLFFAFFWLRGNFQVKKQIQEKSRHSPCSYRLPQIRAGRLGGRNGKICARRARPRHPQQGPGQSGRHQEELRHGRGQLRPAPRLRRNPEPDQVAHGHPGRRPADQEPGFQGRQGRARPGAGPRR